jgi:DUF4097 and DUF4098 domain-containing protein YvlB
VFILKRSPQFVGLLCMLGLLAPLAVAQETQVSRDGSGWSQVITGSLAGVKNLRVRIDAGSVAVHGAQRPGIDYSFHMHSNASSEEDARHQFQNYKVSTFVKGDTAWVVGERKGVHGVHIGPARMMIVTGSERKFSGEFVINIPRDMQLVKIETGGGMVEATGVAGRVEIETGGGKVRVDDVGGSVTAETGGDSIDVGTVGGDLKLETGGGAISIGSVKGTIQAETGGGNVVVLSCEQGAVIEAGCGNVEIKRCLGRVKASTGGGSVTLGDIGGPAEIETGGGSIRLTSAKGRVGANSGAGSIELDGVPSARVETGAGGITVKIINSGAERNDSMLETSTGDITVYIAPDVAVSVRASVELGNGHHINSDFTDIHVASEGDQWGPRTLTAEGKLNGGGPVLKVRTTTGDIWFKRASR